MSVTGFPKREMKYFPYLYGQIQFGTINLVISGLKSGEVRVSIMDLSGKIVLQETFTTTSNKVSRKIDLSTFQRGVYFVKVETDIQVRTEKLILE